jgi:hypothetical protein
MVPGGGVGDATVGAPAGSHAPRSVTMAVIRAAGVTSKAGL